eukprot:TRINITY_DN37524_c0_g1_i1.p1 TRINITY_DN37524_c0_g1~~TRINITY_DN37524_c0_g1_i1.p1  ORF type:complete len:380 (-),score=67.39 TRINITY_DN37524_c0_g1_i1:112-1251(-)
MTPAPGTSNVLGLSKLVENLDLWAQLLSAVDLGTWHRLRSAASWSRLAWHEVEERMRCTVLERDQPPRPCWRLCWDADVTTLWARLSSIKEQDQDPKELCEPVKKDPLLHVTLKGWYEGGGSKEDRLLLLSWLLADPKHSTEVNARNLHGMTPLHICSKTNLAVAARRLLELPHTRVDAHDFYERTPLIVAVREELPEMVKVLLDAKANPNAFVPNCHGHGETALVLAVRLQNAALVKLLLDAPGVDLHLKTMIDCPFGRSALEFAKFGTLDHGQEDGLISKMIEAAIKKEEMKAYVREQARKLALAAAPSADISTSRLEGNMQAPLAGNDKEILGPGTPGMGLESDKIATENCNHLAACFSGCEGVLQRFSAICFRDR